MTPDQGWPGNFDPGLRASWETYAEAVDGTPVNDIDEPIDAARHVWERLSGAARDRDDPLRLMTLATTRDGGGASARIVVLRDVEAAQRVLEFHTDNRSPKVGELEAEPRITLLFWDPETRLQVRAEGRATLHRCDDERAREAFEALPEHGRTVYRSSPSAGTPLSAPGDVTFPRDGVGDAGLRNFALVRVRVDRLDLLHLVDGAQRRAEIRYAGEGATGRWIAP